MMKKMLGARNLVLPAVLMLLCIQTAEAVFKPGDKVRAPGSLGIVGIVQAPLKTTERGKVRVWTKHWECEFWSGELVLIPPKPKCDFPGCKNDIGVMKRPRNGRLWSRITNEKIITYGKPNRGIYRLCSTREPCVQLQQRYITKGFKRKDGELAIRFMIKWFKLQKGEPDMLAYLEKENIGGGPEALAAMLAKKFGDYP